MDLFEVSIMKVVNAKTFCLAHCVVDDNQALVPSRGIGCAGSMCQVMTNTEDLLLGETRQVATHLRKERLPGEHRAIEFLRDLVFEIQIAKRGVVKSVCNLIHFVDRDSRFRQAESDG